MTVGGGVMGCGPSIKAVKVKERADSGDVYRKTAEVNNDDPTQTNANDSDKLQSAPSIEVTSSPSSDSQLGVTVSIPQSEDANSPLTPEISSLETRKSSKSSEIREKIVPLLQPHASGCDSDSLLEFFRILDEKVEQGEEYISES